jgi:hypothetical protein
LNAFVIASVVMAAPAATALGRFVASRLGERRRARRRTRALPEVSGEVAEGREVHIRGIVRAGEELLVSPLSRQRCVMYRVHGIGRLARGGTTFSRRKFVVDRGEAGEVEIDSDHVELDVPLTKRKLHLAQGRESVMLMFGLTRRNLVAVHEVVLLPGDEVTVIGLPILDPATAPPTGERGFRDDAPAQLRLAGSEEHPLTISLVRRG